MGFKKQKFMKKPTLSALRAALLYDPSDSQQPLRCKSDFEGVPQDGKLGARHGGNWLAAIGGVSTYLRNVVWWVVEGSVPAGFKVQQAGFADDNRIVNLYLEDKAGNIRLPKTVSAEEMAECSAAWNKATQPGILGRLLNLPAAALRT